MQTKRQSWVETTTNTGIGFIGSWLITWITMHGIDSIAIAATVATILCTVWSLIRGYCVRRYFNRKHHEHRNGSSK